MEKIGFNLAFVAVPFVLLLIYTVGGVLIIGAGVWLGLRLAWRNNAAYPTTYRVENPHEILKAWYARGEITKEQFEAMKQDLKS